MRARLRLAALLGVLAVTVSACQLRVGTDVRIEEDGSGALTLAVALDEALHDSLTADGFDPFAGLESLPDGWTSSPIEDGRGIEVRAAFPAGGLPDRVEQLQEGLDEEDPVVLDDVELEVADDGAATFSARAGLRPPSSTGIVGPGVTVDGQELAALLEERGEELVRVDLRVVFPGEVADSDADEVDGRTATWHLPVTELRQVSATAEAPVGARVPWPLVAGIAAAAVVVGLVGVRMLRRR